MKIKSRYLFIIYIVALGVNSLDSIKYPDSQIRLINFMISLVFLIAIIEYVIYQVKNNVNNKKINIFLIIAILSGILIYAIVFLKDVVFNNMILDVISNIQFPLYILFVTPLFGLNYIFHINYDVLSIIIAGIYFIIYLINFFLYKYLYQNR